MSQIFAIVIERGEIDDSQRWIKILGRPIQPSESGVGRVHGSPSQMRYCHAITFAPMSSIGVRELLAAIADDQHFIAWDTGEGLDSPESVIAGEIRLDGSRLAVILSDFDVLAGSVGAAACRVVIAALRRAAAEGLHVFASPASGGTRMQEGVPGFVLMADIAAAVAEFKQSGKALLVWLRHPTTGGVMATWGSLGTVTIAQPGALTGFLGPRVYEALTGTAFPPGVQTSENLAAKGVIDEVVPLESLNAYLIRLKRVLARQDAPVPTLAPIAPVPLPGRDAWEAVLNSRDPRRPGARDVLKAAAEVTFLHGTTRGEKSGAILVALGIVGGQSCVIAAQDRHCVEPLGPAALRTAQRAMDIADQLALPLLTIVDTAGAELSRAAEELALAGEIARCLQQLTTLAAPTVSLILGMGCGGGALALLPADRVVAAESAWISPLPLEGASVIQFRTPDRAAEMARAQRITAPEMSAAGIVDVVVPETVAAGDNPDKFVSEMIVAAAQQLGSVRAMSKDQRLRQRRERYSGGLM